MRRSAFTAAIVLVLVAGGACDRGHRGADVTERLPGAEEFAPELRARLAVAVDARTATAPRTHHLRPDGTARFTNRLALEASPYLLQHAHNPVSWYPWGDEAFARARAEGKPIFLSVGYSTCHWCHVMEEESFEDLEVAAYLNEHYVAIKVDREERPDVDDAYMTAVQLLTGNGGWPLNVWLTANREPFFGGTYFPPRDGARGVGLLAILRDLRDAYRDHPLTVAQHATTLTEQVRQAAVNAPGEATPSAAALHAAFGRYRARFDTTYGGFGGAPKFPTPPVLDFLLRYHRRTGDPAALDMVIRTLGQMAGGGVYDQVGGGFHRYATDRAWRVPHFEKMLYDNAQLAAVYLDAHRVTGDPALARVVRETLAAVARDLSDPSGGFYAASDADSPQGEGSYFVWTDDELARVLAPTELGAARAYWGVTRDGNFEGANVLYVPRPAADVATELGTTPAELAGLIESARAKLLAARARRPAPHVDTKILAGWNGLMISAFARAGGLFDDPALMRRAAAAADHVVGTLWDGTRLRRHAGAPAGSEGFVDDYAFLAAGLVDLYDATFDARWLRTALALHERLAAAFWDGEGGGFFATAAGAEAPLVRAKPADDSAIPSGNAIAVDTLLRLAELTGDDRLRARAANALRAFEPRLARAPTSAPRLLGALEFFFDRPPEIVIVAPRGGDEQAARLIATARRTYLPNRALIATVAGTRIADDAALLAIVEGKDALGGVATAYVCEARVCARPTSDPETLARQLAKVHPLPVADRAVAAVRSAD